MRVPTKIVFLVSSEVYNRRLFAQCVGILARIVKLGAGNVEPVSPFIAFAPVVCFPSNMKILLRDLVVVSRGSFFRILKLLTVPLNHGPSLLA